MAKSSLMPSKKEITTQVNEIIASLPNELDAKQRARLAKWYTDFMARMARIFENAVAKA